MRGDLDFRNNADADVDANVEDEDEDQALCEQRQTETKKRPKTEEGWKRVRRTSRVYDVRLKTVRVIHSARRAPPRRSSEIVLSLSLKRASDRFRQQPAIHVFPISFYRRINQSRPYREIMMFACVEIRDLLTTFAFHASLLLTFALPALRSQFPAIAISRRRSREPLTFVRSTSRVSSGRQRGRLRDGMRRDATRRPLVDRQTGQRKNKEPRGSRSPSRASLGLESSTNGDRCSREETPSRVEPSREIRTQDLGLTIDLDSYTLPRGMQSPPTSSARAASSPRSDDRASPTHPSRPPLSPLRFLLYSTELFILSIQPARKQSRLNDSVRHLSRILVN